METTIIYANHVLTSVLVSSNCQEPVKLHDHSSDASCKIWWLSTSEIYSSVSSIRKKLSYRKHVHHNPSIKYASTDVERRESGSMFCETKHFLKFERIEQKAWKHSAEKYHDQTMKFTPFSPWVCLHHTFALHNLIFSDVWRVLTWQYCQNQITASDSM